MAVIKERVSGFSYMSEEWDVGIVDGESGTVLSFGSGSAHLDDDSFQALRECFRAYEKDHPADAQDDETIWRDQTPGPYSGT